MYKSRSVLSKLDINLLTNLKVYRNCSSSSKNGTTCKHYVYEGLPLFHLRPNLPKQSLRTMNIVSSPSTTPLVSSDLQNLRHAHFSSMAQQKLYKWYTLYEDLIGLTEVREAQDRVVKAEKNLQDASEKRRSQQQELSSIQTDLASLHGELQRVARGDERYVKLVTEEHGFLRRETLIKSDLERLEETERAHFGALSSALRDAHERERSRAERTKYWSLLGSLVGAAIGLVGATANNMLRMKRLHTMIQEESQGVVNRVTEALEQDSVARREVLSQVGARASEDGSAEPQSEAGSPKQEIVVGGQDIKDLLTIIRESESSVLREVAGLREVIGRIVASAEQGSVVCVSPEIRLLLGSSEQAIGVKIRENALLTTGGVYAACVLTAAAVYLLSGWR